MNSDVDSESPRTFKLYSMRGIVVATFIGSWLAGAVLISSNYSKVGDSRAAFISIALGLLGYVLLWITSFYISRVEENEYYLQIYLRGSRMVLQLGVVAVIAQLLQGKDLSRHKQEGGEFYGWGRVFGISFLILLVVLVSTFSVAFLRA